LLRTPCSCQSYPGKNVVMRGFQMWRTPSNALDVVMQLALRFTERPKARRPLTMSEEVHLEPWVEITGVLRSIETKKAFLHLEIADTVLSFEIESKEASCAQERINRNLIGRKIGILRTDIAEKPLVVRLIT